MPEELISEIEAAEIEVAELKKLAAKVKNLMPNISRTEVEKWAKLSVATDEQVAELAASKRQEQKAERDALWESLGVVQKEK